MMFLVVAALVATAVAAPRDRLTPPVPTLITEKDSYIIGGSDASAGQFPFIGSLLSSTSSGGSHTCGAVRISSTWVLCAAHCTQSSSRSVWFGIRCRSSTSGGQHRSFSRIVNHPNYGSGAGSFPNDISVLQMSSGVTVGGVANLPSSGDFAGQTATISGWGRTCGSCSLPDCLKYVNIPVLSNSQCSGYWGSSINSGHICVYSGSTGACNGDSGGPMSIGNTVIGITSWGASGCGTSTPSVYSRVTTFRSWIQSVTGV
uniref:Serine protease n=1 Tax=Arenicola cristata TaxID=273048 RepID=A0A0A7CAX0_ARECR|nr:serine protease [Arenicola cristata]